MAAEKVQWKHEKDGEWVDYDEETNQQIEGDLSTSIKTIAKSKNKRLQIVTKLDKGPFFGLAENQKKFSVIIFFDGSQSPPVIQRSVQTSKTNSKAMVNVTRTPCLDSDSSAEYAATAARHKVVNRWHCAEPDAQWSEYDAETATQIELALNAEASFVVLNKGAFSCARKKNLHRIKFNHHSIPSEAEQQRYVSLKKEESAEVKYEPIDGKQAELDLDDEEEEDDDEGDEMWRGCSGEMLVAAKHFMVPISLRFWTKKRELAPQDPPQCSVCFNGFEEHDFLEHWVARKVRGLHAKEERAVSAKRIAIQLSECAGEHFFHAGCIALSFGYKTECPMCKIKYGVMMGDQPKGIMKVRMNKEQDVASEGKENKV